MQNKKEYIFFLNDELQEKVIDIVLFSWEVETN